MFNLREPSLKEIEDVIKATRSTSALLRWHLWKRWQGEGGKLLTSGGVMRDCGSQKKKIQRSLTNQRKKQTDHYLMKTAKICLPFLWHVVIIVQLFFKHFITYKIHFHTYTGVTAVWNSEFKSKENEGMLSYLLACSTARPTDNSTWTRK